jgi:hypothetical protein
MAPRRRSSARRALTLKVRVVGEHLLDGAAADELGRSAGCSGTPEVIADRVLIPHAGASAGGAAAGEEGPVAAAVVAYERAAGGRAPPA